VRSGALNAATIAPVLGVDDDQHPGLARHDKQTLMRLVEREGSVLLSFFDPPPMHDSAGAFVDHRLAHIVKPNGKRYIEADQITDALARDPYGIAYNRFRGDRPGVKKLAVAVLRRGRTSSTRLKTFRTGRFHCSVRRFSMPALNRERR
jgi:hypothetical protein